MQSILSSLSRLAMRALPMLLMAVVAGSTFWLVQINSPREAATGPKTARHEPDYYMDRFAATELDVNGDTKLRFNGDKMVHFEDDQTYEFARPAMRSYDPGRPPVSGRADRGKMNADGSVIDLYDNGLIVRAQGPDPAQDPQMSAASEYFRILVNDDLVKTDKPVQLTRGVSVMNANGLLFNNVTREVQLFGNVRGTIVTTPRGAPAPRS
ncbi:LPS export ABC transporter periplasmic protein LptC [Cupriavidus malaysiensis]|uniref:LPS export ABC transporter periplasmic protein LptC n=1 Tax=Cupriavidus malaysiensis TaxID=367825 RepID=A0ABM6F1S4_9BURK|nr:LPS export ABC transporter periplasmic protein LptC [Cupriavidus malaysiensis]AOZ05021.1 LPS export ABC transporter periplasmic protein LptC [Cupriavidus malaysiensis]